MAHPTCWGFLGASKIAHDLISSMGSLPKDDHRLVAVGARELDRAQSFASKHGIERAYGSYQELVLDKDVNVVYVSTINVSHKELCLLALNHGKHVLCEKPLAINEKDAREILDLAKEKGLFCMEAVWTRFFPLHRDLIPQVQSQGSKIGDVRVVQASFGIKDGKSKPRVLALNLGGGALLDIGIYCLTFADMVYDGEMPTSISASGTKMDTGVDETACVSMTYSGNRMAHVVASMDACLPNEALIAGTKGNIKIHAPFWCPESFIVSDGTEKEYPLPCIDKSFIFPNGVGMRYEVQAVREALLAGQMESTIVPHSVSLRMLQIMDKIRQQIGVVFPQDKA